MSEIINKILSEFFIKFAINQFKFRVMKKKYSYLLAILVMVLFSSCQSPMAHVTYYIDYQQASQGKVFITQSNTVAFEYDPLGSILVEEIPGTVKLSSPTTEKQIDELYGVVTETKKTKTYSNATAQSALNYAVYKVLELGGDGLINLQLTSYNSDKQRVVQVSGMVIKRK